LKIEQFKRQSAQRRTTDEEQDKMLSNTPDPSFEWFLINPPDPKKIKQHDIPWESDAFGDCKFINPKGRKK